MPWLALFPLYFFWSQGEDILCILETKGSLTWVWTAPKGILPGGAKWESERRQPEFEEWEKSWQLAAGKASSLRRVLRFSVWAALKKPTNLSHKIRVSSGHPLPAENQHHATTGLVSQAVLIPSIPQLDTRGNLSGVTIPFIVQTCIIWMKKGTFKIMSGQPT